MLHFSSWARRAFAGTCAGNNTMIGLPMNDFGLIRTSARHINSSTRCGFEQKLLEPPNKPRSMTAIELQPLLQQNSLCKVVEKKCSSDLSEAVRLFGVISDDGTAPIVLTPRARTCCSYFLSNDISKILVNFCVTYISRAAIPSGVSAIVQRFGADVVRAHFP